MQSELGELLHTWHDFYLLVGTASATLVGLMFVAASIGAQVFSESNRAGTGAFVSPTVVHFSSAFVLCVLGTIPAHTWLTLGALPALVGIAGAVYSANVWMQLFIRRRFTVDVVDRLFYALIPLAAYLVVIAAAVVLFTRPNVGLELLAAGLLILVIAGLRNAWDMMIWIMLKIPIDKPPTQPPPTQSP
jgi:hypothetical protein